MKIIILATLFLGSISQASVINCENKNYKLQLETTSKAFDNYELEVPLFLGSEITITEKKTGNVFKNKNVSLSHDGVGTLTWQVFARSDLYGAGHVSVLKVISDHEQPYIEVKAKLSSSMLYHMGMEKDAPAWMTSYDKDNWVVNAKFERNEEGCGL